MAIITRFDKHGKGVPGDGVAAYCTAGVVAGAGQVAVDAMDIGLTVQHVSLILDLILMAGGAKGIGRCRRPRLLSMHFVAVNTGNANTAVLARSPLGQSTGVTFAAHLGRGGDSHAFFGVPRTVGAVAGFAGYAGQNKLAGGGIIAGGVAGKTFAWFFFGLQIGLENWIKCSLSMGGVRPGFKFRLMTFTALLGALVITPCRQRGAIAQGFIIQRNASRWPQ